MDNSQGTVTLTATKLARECYSSEQERLEAYAAALRVPVQIGAEIKGDAGQDGARGDKGERGDKGDRGDAGPPPTPSIVDYEVPSGVNEVEATGDVTSSIINLIYNGESAPTTKNISIATLYYDGTNTIIYLTDVTPDEFYRIRVTNWS